METVCGKFDLSDGSISVTGQKPCEESQHAYWADEGSTAAGSKPFDPSQPDTYGENLGGLLNCFLFDDPEDSVQPQITPLLDRPESMSSIHLSSGFDMMCC